MDVFHLKVNPDWDEEVDARLLTDIGYACENGTIFCQDYQAAVSLYALAVKGGDSRAMVNLARMYEEGKGVEQNIRKAVAFYTAAAERENNTEAMVNLGYIYENGLVTGEPNYDECFRWYSKAAELGDDDGKFNYANCLHWGHGVRRNRKKAFPIFQELAIKGYPGACFYMGLYYQEGVNVKRNYLAAREYYRLGALEGDKYCYCQLGVLYAEGNGVEQDKRAAADYYRKAGSLGDPLGFTNLGWLLENGDLGEPDLKNAIRYYGYAAKAGEEHAIEALTRLGQELP